MPRFARSARVTIDRRAVGKLLGSGGPVDANARAKAVKVAQIARTLVPEGKTKNLKRSIRAVPAKRPGWNVEAGRSPRAPYALIVHKGRKRMPEKSPTSAKPFYVFEGRDGELVFTRGPIKRVKGVPYLTEAARRVGLKVRVKGGR